MSSTLSWNAVNVLNIGMLCHSANRSLHIGQFVTNLTFCPERAAAHNCTYSDNTQDLTETQSNSLCTIHILLKKEGGGKI